MISGLLLMKWTWPSIFWFLSIASPVVLLIMVLFLPETCRALVGNGSIRISCVKTPFIPILCPQGDQLAGTRHEQRKDPPKLPSPLSVLALLTNRATMAVVLCYGIYYTVHSCLQASLSTIFVDVYHVSGLVAGLVYIPFGVACSIASFLAGMPYLIPRFLLNIGFIKLKADVGKIIDRDYRITAKAQGFTIDRVGGDDLTTFPIEHARLRTHKYSIFLCASLIAAYGWVLQAQVVMVFFPNDDESRQLTGLAYSSSSSSSILYWILQPSSLHGKSSVGISEEALQLIRLVIKHAARRLPPRPVCFSTGR